MKLIIIQFLESVGRMFEMYVEILLFLPLVSRKSTLTPLALVFGLSAARLHAGDKKSPTPCGGGRFI